MRQGVDVSRLIAIQNNADIPGVKKLRKFWCNALTIGEEFNLEITAAQIVDEQCEVRGSRCVRVNENTSARAQLDRLIEDRANFLER
jgi:hypothetical protein